MARKTAKKDSAKTSDAVKEIMDRDGLSEEAATAKLDSESLKEQTAEDMLAWQEAVKKVADEHEIPVPMQEAMGVEFLMHFREVQGKAWAEIESEVDSDSTFDEFLQNLQTLTDQAIAGGSGTAV